MDPDSVRESVLGRARHQREEEEEHLGTAREEGNNVGVDEREIKRGVGETPPGVLQG